MHLCSLCCAPRCCARNGWSLTIISLIARMFQPSCQTNPIISIIPFLGFQVKKRSFVFLSLRKVRSFDRRKKEVQVLSILFQTHDSIFPIRLTKLGSRYIYSSSTLDRRAREEDPSRCLVIQPAATMLYVSSKKEEEREADATEKGARRGREEKERRWDRNRESRQATTSSTNLEFKLARPVGDVTQYFRFRRTRIAANDVNAPSSSPLVVARNVVPVALSAFLGG